MYPPRTLEPYEVKKAILIHFKDESFSSSFEAFYRIKSFNILIQMQGWKGRQKNFPAALRRNKTFPFYGPWSQLVFYFRNT